MSHSATELETRPASATLLDRFVAEALAVAATVECVERSANAIATAVARAAPGAKRIVVADPTDVLEEFFSAVRNLPGVFAERSRTALATADVGITDAFAAIATTGSICVRVDAGYAGYASLLARTHIVVVDSERIVERPSDLFRSECLNGEGLRADFVYVTGPSATADMGPLVRGVHGPHFLHIIVLV